MGMLIFFLIGIGIGVFLFIITFLIVVSVAKARDSKINKIDYSIPDEEIMEVFNKHIQMYDEIKNKGELGHIKVIVDVNYSLINEIAKLYFKESKYPMFELSTKEIIELNFHILDRIDKLLNKPFIGKIRHSTIESIVRKNKEKAEKKKLEAEKDAKRGFFAKIRPIKFIKNKIVGRASNILFKMIFKSSIKIVGEEATKVYSKSLFAKENKINIEIEEEL